MKTVAYLRVSTENQALEGHGLASQQSACVAWATQNEVEIEEYFTDVASGALSSRPEIDRLRLSVARGEVSKLVVYSVDRLGRDLVDTESTIRELEKAGCEIVSVTQYFENNPAGKLLRHMLLAFAEFERALIKARLKGGRKAAKAKGLYMSGVAPFGLRNTGKGGLEQIPVEMSIVKEVLEESARGLSLRQIRATQAEPMPVSTLAKIVKRRTFYEKYLTP